MNKSDIDNAIGEHAVWKSHLKKVILTGKLDAPLNEMKVDNLCAFGTWFYGPAMHAGVKTSPHYQAVKELHAEFHKIAAKVAELASTGEKAEAEKLLEVGGAFATISSRLTNAMMKWKESL